MLTARALDLLGGPLLVIPIAILVLAFLLTVHELGHHVTAKKLGVNVLEFGLGWPPRLAGRMFGGTLYSLNLLPFGAFVRMLGDSDGVAGEGSFSARPRWARALILVGGPLLNLLLAPVLFTAASLISDFEGVEVSRVAPGSPAQAAGLQSGDVLITIAGTRIEIPTDVGEAVTANKGRLIRIEVMRNDDLAAFDVVPRTAPPPGEGPLGVTIRPHMSPAPLLTAVPRGLNRAGEAILLLPRYLAAAASGAVGFELSGPVGIVDVVGQAVRQGPEVVLFLAAVITAQLGIMNLLPWPGLDGGRLLLLGLETIRGRRLPPAGERAINFFGIMLLVTLALVVTVGDVRRLAGG